MSKQTFLIRRNCQHENCVRDAVIGIYRWEQGDTDVNLDRPIKVVCGEHKPHFDYRRGQYFRNVRLTRSAHIRLTMTFLKSFGLGLFLIAWMLSGGWVVVTLSMHWKLQSLDLAPGLFASIGVLILVGCLFLAWAD